MCLAIWSFWMAAVTAVERGVLVVEISLRRGREHVHVDARRVHVFKAARNIETAGRERPVQHAGDVEGGVLGVIRRDGHLGAGLADHGGGFQGADVGVGVDRAHFAHFVL